VAHTQQAGLQAQPRPLKLRLTGLALAFALLLAPLHPQNIQARLAELQAEAGFPGITAGVVLPDGRLITAAAGWADLDHKAALTPDSRMLAGSTGKTFCAAVILQAVDEGKLDLDSNLDRWLGKEPWFDRLPNAHELTLRLLMGHRSGLNDYVFDKDFRPAFTADIGRNWSALELAGFTFDKKALFPAGTSFAYADANFVIAGLVFEIVTGRKLFSEVERRVLKPRKLEHTVTSESRIDKDLAPGWLNPRTPFKLEGSTLRDGRLILNAQAEYAGGGIISTAGDLARWATLLWQGKAFSEAMLKEMLDAKPTGTGRGGGKDAQYGLAVQIQPSEFGTTYSHAGWFPGYQTEMVYFPEEKIAVSVQVNGDPVGYKRSPRYCVNELLRVALAR